MRKHEAKKLLDGLYKDIGGDPVSQLEKEVVAAVNLKIELGIKTPKRRRPKRNKKNIIILPGLQQVQTNFASKVNRYVQEHTSKEEHEGYRKQVKGICSVCDKKLPNTIEYYELNGNYCVPCCQKSEKQAKGARLGEKELDAAFRPLVQFALGKDPQPMV